MANINKTEYIMRSLSRTIHKRAEFFAINRIFHKINDLDVEFVTQQYIRLQNGKHALSDLYFP